MDPITSTSTSTSTSTGTSNPAQQQAVQQALLGGSGGSLAGSFAGFDFAQPAANRDVTKSAKYAFAEAAGRSGILPRTHQEAESWFNQHVKPFLEQQGFKVDAVKGDKAWIRTRENPQGSWVDFLQDAGGENPMFAWQPDMPQTPDLPVITPTAQPAPVAGPTLGSDKESRSTYARIQELWESLSPEERRQVAVMMGLQA